MPSTSSAPCRLNTRRGATGCPSPWPSPGPPSSSGASATSTWTRSTSTCRGGSDETDPLRSWWGTVAAAVSCSSSRCQSCTMPGSVRLRHRSSESSRLTIRALRALAGQPWMGWERSVRAICSRTLLGTGRRRRSRRSRRRRRRRSSRSARLHSWHSSPYSAGQVWPQLHRFRGAVVTRARGGDGSSLRDSVRGSLGVQSGVQNRVQLSAISARIPGCFCGCSGSVNT